MYVQTIRTDRIEAGTSTLLSLLDKFVQEFEERSVLAITSKIVSLCENSVVAYGSVDREELIRSESDLFLPSTLSKYGHHFTIRNNTLAAAAGIDESNGNDYYILWPKDPQATANQVRAYLCRRFGVQYAGVIITDSTCTPMRRGTSGVSLAHSGFKALRNYIGTPDLFGHTMKVSQANVAGGLAATTVFAMGEGTEQTPLCLVRDLSDVEFQDRNPSTEELSEIYMPVQEDLFAPFLTAVQWEQNQRNS